MPTHEILPLTLLLNRSLNPPCEYTGCDAMLWNGTEGLPNVRGARYVLNLHIAPGVGVLVPANEGSGVVQGSGAGAPEVTTPLGGQAPVLPVEAIIGMKINDYSTKFTARDDYTVSGGHSLKATTAWHLQQAVASQGECQQAPMLAACPATARASGGCWKGLTVLWGACHQALMPAALAKVMESASCWECTAAPLAAVMHQSCRMISRYGGTRVSSNNSKSSRSSKSSRGIRPHAARIGSCGCRPLMWRVMDGSGWHT